MSKNSNNKLRISSTGSIGVAFIIFSLVGSGAFGIEEMIPLIGPGLSILILIIMQIFWARPICYSVMECNYVIPKEGGIYAWAKEVFGGFWGFQAGWWAAISTWICSGTYITLASGYITQLTNCDEIMSIIIRFVIIFVFTLINLKGLSHVSWTENVLSVIILFVFAAVTVVGFANWTSNPIDPFVSPETSISSGLGEGMAIAIWMFCGYEQVATMSEEFKNAKILTIGMKIALPLIALSYILPTLASLACLPQGSWANWAVDGGIDLDTVGYASVASQFIGNSGRIIFLLTATFAQFASFNTNMTTGSRSFYVLAQDNFLPKSFAKTDDQKRSPYIGIIIIAITSFVLSFFEFNILVQMELIYIIASYILLAFIVLKLRKLYPLKTRNLKDSFYIKGGKFGLFYVCFFPIAISVLTILFSDIEFVVYAAFSINVGLIAYFVLKKFFDNRKEKKIGSSCNNTNSKFKKCISKKNIYHAFYLFIASICIVLFKLIIVMFI